MVAARRCWINARQRQMRDQPARLVFVDETAVTTKMVRLRGRSRRGTRLPGAAPFGHWHTQTFIAGLRCDALTAPWVVDKALDRTAFDLWVETQLAPTLSPGDVVRLHIVTRRFCCEVSDCPRRIFAERFDEAVLPVRSRRTARLEGLVHHLGLALGGRPAASFAKRLMLPVSNDTLLRVVRRRARSGVGALNVVGIDDWAFRRNHRYGTIVCDLERRRVVALLPDRERATIEAWLGDHPEIQIVSRDRGGGYGEAAAKALPRALQVADRWHLFENASAAFLDAVRKSMRAIRTAIGATMINPDLLTCAEKLQYEGYLRREETNADC